ncbi:MAG: flavodoxin domain-containing protein, partial [Ktedonobacteraceae bacterium]|nr:flavodoxin domain-containing protein [Ktedonobacteraceae bacterium]
RFKFIDHLNYQFKIKETLTLKPEDFKIKISKRTSADRLTITNGMPAPTISVPQVEIAPLPTEMPAHRTPVLVLFGSNLGTAEDLANRITNDAEAHGFSARAAPLDEYTNKLPQEGVVIVVTASYNGTPPDNAAQFYDWLKASELSHEALRGVNYTVFGVGHHDWATTYQAIPRLVDEALERFGARRIYPRGEGDQGADFDGSFESWYTPLWGTLFTALNIAAPLPEQKSTGELQVEVVDVTRMHPAVASFGAQPMKVLVNRELYRDNGEQLLERSARHIEVQLPTGVSYRTGLHLGIIPTSTPAQVSRVARRFNLDENVLIILHKSGQRKTILPIETLISVHDLLTAYVELQDLATRKQIKVLAQHTPCPPEQKKLQALSGEDEASLALYRHEVLEKHKSLIDLLEEYPSCELPFNIYLELLSAIRPRYYSISSSPLHDELRASLTLAVVDAPARSGHGHYLGACSNYLRERQVGDFIYAFVQDTHSPFMLPQDATVPLIMIGPGTGIAPFRGFLQERAELQEQGVRIGPSLLFFGCHHPEQDFLYEDELKEFVRQGVTELYTAFSRWEGHPKRYVQDAILEHGERLWQLLESGGAIVYVCGDAAHMAPGVRQAFATLYTTRTGRSAEDANHWLDELVATGRYLVDVWPA